MEAINVFWIFVFISLLTLIHLIHHLIVKSLKEKPLGNQSIFDSAIMDTFFVMKCYGTMVCSMSSLGSFESFRKFLIDSPSLLSIGCVAYAFGLISLCVNAGHKCTHRSEAWNLRIPIPFI